MVVYSAVIISQFFSNCLKFVFKEDEGLSAHHMFWIIHDCNVRGEEEIAIDMTGISGIPLTLQFSNLTSSQNEHEVINLVLGPK